MRRALLFPLIIGTLAVSTLTGQRRNLVEEQAPIRRTLEFSAGSSMKMLEVDGISGSIQVNGYDGRTIEMVARQSIRADSEDRLRAAKSEVKLDITEKSDIVSIFVDEPGRQRAGQSAGRTLRRDPGYDVTFDFELRVPRDARVRLKTVNGNIVVRNSSGDFDVEGINGGIEMRDVSGSGHVHTING